MKMSESSVVYMSRNMRNAFKRVTLCRRFLRKTANMPIANLPCKSQLLRVSGVSIMCHGEVNSAQIPVMYDLLQMEKRWTVPKKVVDGIAIELLFSDEKFLDARKFRHRDGDLVVTTYPKCGTTWTSHIVGHILCYGECLSRGDNADMFLSVSCTTAPLLLWNL